MLLLQRGDETVEIENPEWAAMLVYLVQCGWKPSVPSYFFLAGNNAMTDKDAATLCDIAATIFDNALHKPLQAYSAIKFAKSKFYEVVEFAKSGGFTMTSKK